MEKIKKIEEWISNEKRVVVAFSGGVDSSVLLYLAYRVLAEDVIAITGDSPTLPDHDRKVIDIFCEKYSVQHKYIQTDELECEDFIKNPENRCYYCKKILFTKLLSYAQKYGFNSVLDGTNYSDLSGHRPGFRAIKELDGVKTPYVDLKISKQEIIEIAGYLNLLVANKPASACLASRIPSGQMINKEILMKVDKAEDAIKKYGVKQIRVRHHGDLARIECVKNELELLIKYRKEIFNDIRSIGYKYVTFNLMFYGE